VRHARCQSRRSLAARGRCGVTPAAVTRAIFGHLRGDADGRKCWVMVGVEAVLLDFLATLVLVVLALLAFPPEEEGAENEERDDDEGNHNGNGSLASGAEAVRGILACALKLRGVGARWVR